MEFVQNCFWELAVLSQQDDPQFCSDFELGIGTLLSGEGSSIQKFKYKHLFQLQDQTITMDRYHSIVGPMVSQRWKPLKNHRVQWLPDYKTIEKPLVPMVAGLKTIVKPLLPMVCQTKTIVKPLISMVAFQPFIQWQW